MTVGLAMGTMIGLGLTAVLWGLFPPREPLQIRLSELGQPIDHANRSNALRKRLGHAAAQSFGSLAFRGQRLERDLRAAGQSPEAMALAKLGMLVLGMGLPVGVWIVTWLARAWVSPAVVVLASVVTGGLFFFVPDLSLRERAQKRRRELRSHVSAYLDLVGLHLSGGSGIERALADAADQGAAWGFVEIQRTLRQAQLANEPPWTALARLGEDLGSPELEELAAWLMLAGTSGLSSAVVLERQGSGIARASFERSGNGSTAGN